MIKRILFAVFVIALASCKGGNKGPVMATKEEAKVNMDQDATAHVANVATTKQKINIDKEEGVLSVAEIIEKRELLSGKTVSVKGEVTKYNPAIMNRNWVHIQDGTEYNGEFDLTITTTEAVTVGDQLILTGILAIDKDFGYGYKYSTILESAVLKK